MKPQREQVITGGVPAASAGGFTGDGLDWARIETPCQILDLATLDRNLNRLGAVMERTGCRILMALKAFAFHPVFPRIGQILHGAAASSYNEAQLAHDAFGGELHLFAPAYRRDEFMKSLPLVDHIVFNSFSQWQGYKPVVAGSRRDIACGMRVNPMHSEVATPMYDPCAPHSRLGVTPDHFDRAAFDGLTGLHFHTLCELGADALERTLDAVTHHFGDLFPRLSWINFGGGHHITRPGYEIDRLCRILETFRHRTGLTVYLEPGEAVVLNAGILAASVLDVVDNQGPIAILDTSAAAHMPDVLEMPYRPAVVGAGLPGEFPHTYRLAGCTCLAGDVIGDYAFPEPLQVGQTLVFLDMAHYSVVKSTMFNGVAAPSLAVFDSRTGDYRVCRRFGYDDYRMRMG